ncbi:MAG: glucosyl-3-phosphoglycerate synthase [Chloroflexi bacterium]|nr:glucosyl-3-phosphoglycerate synthase [Chloroflexota bacterium]
MSNGNHNILIAITGIAQLDALLSFALITAESPRTNIVILGLVPVPEHKSLTSATLKARDLRQAIDPIARKIGARAIISVAHNIWRDLKRTAINERSSVILLHHTDVPPFEWLNVLPCEVIVVKPPFTPKNPRILLPIRGGPYAAMALRLALSLAESQGGEITALHAIASSDVDNGEKQYLDLVRNLRELPKITRWIKTHGDPINAIVRAARNHHLVIMGAVDRPRSGDPPVGVTAATVLSQIKTPAMVVRASQRTPLFFVREPEAHPIDHTVSVVVDKWFAENTFHAHEFQDIEQLVELKQQQNLTISLGLPTLNEQRTIGKIIKSIKSSLMVKHPLLDEIVVIDSNSTDRTVEIAEGLGVPVVKHPDILPQYGACKGKGEALWKSLSVLRGDLIAWIDTDISNIHPRFVYGILGPLIREPRLMYVKGFYQRPLHLGRKLEARGGGRVTELMARPMINLFYPELSGLLQPLAGEYAGRRQALESVPFFTGYGVETGLLIDLFSIFGLNAIGQVDLEERIHRNQSLMALSKMSFEIIQVFMQRIGRARRVNLVNDMNKSMKLIRQARTQFQLDVTDIRAFERPPMNTLKEYRDWRAQIKSERKRGRIQMEQESILPV